MKPTIEFASAEEMATASLLHPVAKPRTKPAYEDLILRPEYLQRKFVFGKGQTCIRILPQLAGSDGWMRRIHVIAHLNGQHVSPKSLMPKGKSVYDIAYSWLRVHRPETLQSKANRDGFRLLPSMQAICWLLVEIGGEMQAKLFVGSAYDGGTSGGNCGIAHQLLQAASQLKEPGGYDATHPDHGTQIIVEKTTPHGAKYPTYKMTRASVEAPIHRYLERMDESELEAICPLSEVLRHVGPDEEWELLARVIGQELSDEIRNATVKPQLVSHVSHELSSTDEYPTYANDEPVQTSDDAIPW